MALSSSELCDHVTSVMTNSLGYYLLFEVKRLGRGSYTILDTTSGSWGGSVYGVVSVLDYQLRHRFQKVS